MNKKIVIFPDKLREESTTEEIFCGYIEGGLFLEGGDVRLSRTHRQPNRIYSANGIHPTISSSETQGRYFIAMRTNKIIKLGNLTEGYNHANQVFDPDGISPALTAAMGMGGGHWPLIIDSKKNNGTQKPQQDYPKMKTDNMFNVITLFSGYDSQCLALNRLGLPYELKAWCEIDKHAITAHNALFPQWSGRNLGDVSKVDWAEWHKQHPQPIDLLTYTSPCQDFSSAGLQRGGEEGSGTRSGLLWETERAVRELRPRHLVFENVGGLVSDKFIDLFNRWQARLNGYGYTNFSQLMNAKDYGVPQNRLRIFMVSILNCNRAYYFPEPFPLTRRLKDVLEQNVEERYYLSDERVAKLMQETEIHRDRGNNFAFRPRTPEEIAFTVKCSGKGDKTDNYIAEPQMLGWTRNEKGEITDRHPVSVANCVTAAKRDNTQNYVMEPTIISPGHGYFDGAANTETSPTVKCSAMQAQHFLIEPTIIEDFYGTVRDPRLYTDEAPTLRADRTGLMTTEGIRIRRLTERELYRLMDVDEKDIDTLLAAPIPCTQHAKLAGNSIAVACLYYIFRNLFVDTEPAAGVQTKLF